MKLRSVGGRENSDPDAGLGPDHARRAPMPMAGAGYLVKPELRVWRSG